MRQSGELKYIYKKLIYFSINLSKKFSQIKKDIERKHAEKVRSKMRSYAQDETHISSLASLDGIRSAKFLRKERRNDQEINYKDVR